MMQTLNVDGFLEYAYNTEEYTQDQLEVIKDALYALEGDMARLSWKQYGIKSHEYIYDNLTECCEKLEVYMMTGGLKRSKAISAVNDFKRWMRVGME